MVDLAAKVVGCGNVTGAKLDKFSKFGLTPVPAKKVRAPLIAECYASLECKVIDTTLVAKYCFFIIEVIAAWVDPAVKKPRTIHHLGRGNFMVAGERIKLPSRMK
jgi:flavin reductase (DIM6/NTAB) family NADH-FMN oxidoreductase RutF